MRARVYCLIATTQHGYSAGSGVAWVIGARVADCNLSAEDSQNEHQIEGRSPENREPDISPGHIHPGHPPHYSPTDISPAHFYPHRTFPPCSQFVNCRVHGTKQLNPECFKWGKWICPWVDVLLLENRMQCGILDFSILKWRLWVDCEAKGGPNWVLVGNSPLLSVPPPLLLTRSPYAVVPSHALF